MERSLRDAGEFISERAIVGPPVILYVKRPSASLTTFDFQSEAII